MRAGPLCAYPGCGKPETDVRHCPYDHRCDRSMWTHYFMAPSLAERLDALERAVDKFGRELFLLQSSAVRAGLAEHAPELKKRTASPAPEPTKPKRQHRSRLGATDWGAWHDATDECYRELGANEFRDAPEPPEPRRLRFHRVPTSTFDELDVCFAPVCFLEHADFVEQHVEAAIEKAKETK